MQTKKNVFLWALYDFANSLVSIVFFLYFAQWLVIDQGVADIWFNLTFNFYEKEQVIGIEDKNLAQARLALVSATKIVLSNLFDILGISKPARM